MSHSDDVGNLFRHFGGDAADYQELTQEADLNLARQRWPMLSARLDGERAPIPPAVPDGAAPVRAIAATSPGAVPAHTAAGEPDRPVPPFLRRGAPPVATPIRPVAPAFSERAIVPAAAPTAVPTAVPAAPAAALSPVVAHADVAKALETAAAADAGFASPAHRATVTPSPQRAPQSAEPGGLSALFRRLEGTPAAASDLSSSLRKLAGAGKQRP